MREDFIGAFARRPSRPHLILIGTMGKDNCSRRSETAWEICCGNGGGLFTRERNVVQVVTFGRVRLFILFPAGTHKTSDRKCSHVFKKWTLPYSKSGVYQQNFPARRTQVLITLIRMAWSRHSTQPRQKNAPYLTSHVTIPRNRYLYMTAKCIF